MNLDSLSFALSQISYSVANLTKKNYKSSVQEISHLIAQHGAEADRHLFRCLFSHVDFSGDGKSSGKDFHQTQYLNQECTTLLTKPNFVSTLCYAIDNPLHHQKSLRPSPHLFSQLSKVLKLSRVQEVAFGLALLHSASADTRSFAAQYVKTKLPALLQSYIEPEGGNASEGVLTDVAIEVLHLILAHLVGSKQNSGVAPEQRQAFLTKLVQAEFPPDRTPVVLAPLLYPEAKDLSLDNLNTNPAHSVPKSIMEKSLADIIQEIGYVFTASADECRNTLLRFGARELNNAAIAQVLGRMANTTEGLTDHIPVQTSGQWGADGKDKAGTEPSSWNVELFVNVVKDVAPHVKWREVVLEYDHAGFVVKTKAGLRVVVAAIQTALLPPGATKDSVTKQETIFPIEYILRPWKHTEGQLSFITHTLHNPDVLCLNQFPYRCAAIDALKSAAPDGDENRDIATWRSLDLVECLLRLAECGHYKEVADLFKFPHQHCPDILVMALLQIPSWNSLKHDLLSSLMPIFLDNHANSGIVLHYAWHCQGQSSTIRTLIMHAMAEWYMRGEHHDQGRLSRILDVAQDLKALSMLLNATPFAFVIDLACLASRREYLKLEKWLHDKIREHGEPFISACVLFLKRRCPSLLLGPGSKDEAAAAAAALQAKSQQLQPETLHTLLGCLSNVCQSGSVSKELQEAIVTMLLKARNTLTQQNAPSGPPGAAPGPPGPPGPAGKQPPGPPGPPMPPTQMQPPQNAGPMSNANVGQMQQQQQRMSAAGMMPPAASSAATGPPMPPQGLPASMAQGLNSSAAPGSPAKGFQPPPHPSQQQQQGQGQGQQQSGGFNSMQSLTSQLQAGMHVRNPLQSHLQRLPTPIQPPKGLGLDQNPLGGGPGGPPGSGGGLGSMASGMPGGLGGLTNSMGGNPTGPGSLSNLSIQATALSKGSTAGPGGSMQGPGGGGLSNPAEVSSLLSNQQFQNQQFSKEIEDEANSYFQRIYNQPPHPSNISIDEVLDMLKRFKDSPNKKERDVFACMLRNLFEEYRFFPQYPDRELQTTAILFGGIIEQGLVTYMDLGIALRYVLEALKKPHNTKMYYFGIAALDRFKTRLKDYPQYCQHLASIGHFPQFPNHLSEYVEYGARSQEPPGRPQGPVLPPPQPQPQPQPSQPPAPQPTPQGPPAGVGSTGLGGLVHPVLHQPIVPTPPSSTSASTAAPAPAAPATTTASHGAIARPTQAVISAKPSIATATNIDTLLAGQETANEEIAVPPEPVQDKVFFIFNNLSLANMDQKGKEMKECLKEDYIAWMAQYMVMKRASIEHNFHTLYAKFIDYLKYKDALQFTIKETYRNIRVLLRSDKGVQNFSDRSLLKNLGHWLGMLTLAKNKPILHNDIDLKSLLYEAYHKGSQELLYVVPFVAKIMESCGGSRIFQPPNPWTMGLLNVLAELHQEPDLKLNLKFEIEVLCKNLSVDVQELSPGRYLADTERLETIEHQLSAPIKPAESAGTPQPDEPLQINMPTPTTAMLNSAATATTSSSGATSSSMSSSVAPAGGLPGAPIPQFSYQDINITSFAGLAPHITINDQLGLFQAHPHVKHLVRPAIERAVQDFLPAVVERSMKIALTTCEHIVRKDFALDPEEARMRSAAHHMVRFMTAGMALITCKDPLHVAIQTHMKSAFYSSMRNATPQQKELMEAACAALATDNVELCCAFIQKTAVEKALPEMDKRLLEDFQMRKVARSENRRFCDAHVLTYQAERMPEQIRLKVGGVTPQQIAVYEEFARNVPGFLPTVQESVMGGMMGGPGRPGGGPQIGPSGGSGGQMGGFPSDDMSEVYAKLAHEIEVFIRSMGNQPNPPIGGTQLQMLRALWEAVSHARGNRDPGTAQALIKRAVEGLLEGYTTSGTSGPDEMSRFRDLHLLVLHSLQDQRAYGPQWTNKAITRLLVEWREESRYNVDAVEALIRRRYVLMQEYDLSMAQSMENGLNYSATSFAMSIVGRVCLKAPGAEDAQALDQDLLTTIETLSRIAAHSRQAPEGLMNLIDQIRQQQHDGGLMERAGGGGGPGGGPGGSGPTSMMHSGITQAREFDDPPGLHEKTEYLLREWVGMYHSPAAGRDSTKAFSAFVGQMHGQGILKTDDLITRFFRLCTEMCVDLCYRALGEATPGGAGATSVGGPGGSATLVRAKCFHTLDAFVRLIALLVKHSGDTSNTVTKINLLNKVLGIVAGVLLQDHEVRHNEFQQLPYHRIFIMLFIELNAPEHVLESINFQVLTAFCNTLHILRPAKAPGFAYAWLELVSHRVFIGRMLAITPATRVGNEQGWGMYAQLLIDLFKFLGPFLRNAELTKPMQLLYKGTLRVLLVLLHDFPEFLCDYHYPFCDVIPPNCIQVRNLILSAYPRQMRLPDPFTPNLKVDMLQEISHPPRIMTNFASMITPTSFKNDLDSYIKTRSPVTFLSELRSNLQVSNEPGMRYNIPLINALVLYVGTQAISYIHSKGHTPSMSTIAHSAHMDIFQNLAVDLDTEGRYLFLNSITNQLRYPNSHTHYFSCTLLYLFVEANTEAIQEQITRVLLERLIVNRPHPWGLLITFIELLKNPQFKFWNHDFVHCAPQIEKLFECVGRSFLTPRTPAVGGAPGPVGVIAAPGGGIRGAGAGENDSAAPQPAGTAAAQ